ncbi:MAG: hypothetical protein QXV16_01615 [Candidatus Anstonellales archaeon]
MGENIMDEDKDNFKVRRFSIRIIRDGNNPPKIEISNNFDKEEMERFNREMEMFNKMIERMFRGFGISFDMKNIELAEEENINMPLFEVSREGNRMNITVLLNKNYDINDLHMEIVRGKLNIVSDKMNVKIPLHEDFHKAKIVDKSIKNGILNVVLER